MSEYKLAEAIVALSTSRTWDEAKLEWQLDEIYNQDEPDTCLCGHFPIVEICVLRNGRNGSRAEVGNLSVKKFLGLPSDRIFNAIARGAGDIKRALNAEAIDHAHRRGWINDWERGFYFDTMRKRLLSNKQMAKRVQINRLVLKQTSRTRAVRARPEPVVRAPTKTKAD